MSATQTLPYFEYTNIPNDGVSEEIRAVTLAYKPHMSPARWTPIRQFVLLCALTMGAPNTKWMLDSLAMLARYVDWATRVSANPMDPTIFHPSVIARYVLARKWTSLKHQQLTEARLHRTAQALGHEVSLRRVNMVVTDAQPYTLAERILTNTWAGQQAIARTRQDAYAVIGFAGGAGTRAKELVDIRRRDVEVSENGIVVNIEGDFPRRIAVLPEYEAAVVRAIDNLEPDEWVVLPHYKPELRNQGVSNFGRPSAGAHRPSAAKFRVTWVMHYIDVLPFKTLMHAAGYKTPGSLKRFYDLAQSVDSDQLVELLREGGESE